MSADQRGLPLIAGLCTLCGALVAWNITDLVAGARIAKVQTVADANLQQAEQKWTACLRNTYFTVGTAIYRCRTEKSELTTAQVPELGNTPVATF